MDYVKIIWGVEKPELLNFGVMRANDPRLSEYLLIGTREGINRYAPIETTPR